MSNKAEELSFRPFTVLLGIILGTLFAIAFCTCIVGFVFWVLSDEAPRLASEIDSLIQITWIFVILTVLAAFSFIGSLKAADWRYLAIAGLWAGLFSTGYYYWP
jgi:uncharacterized membrane protein